MSIDLKTLTANAKTAKEITDVLESPVGKEAIKNVVKGTRSRPAKVRKHKLTTAYKQDVAEQLDKLHAAGQEFLALTPSPDVRGFEIITYTEG